MRESQKWAVKWIAGVTFGIALISLASAASAETIRTASGVKPAEPIAQKCLQDLQDFDRELWRVGFGVLLNYGPYISGAPRDFGSYDVMTTPRQKIKALHGAAYVYAYSGDKKMCQRTLASMRAIFEQHQKALDKQGDTNSRMKWRQAHLLRAEPIDQMNHILSTSSIIGSEIHNLKDERLGEITDIVLNPEKHDLMYVLASHGGLFGIDGKLVAIPWADLRVTSDLRIYVLDVTPTVFDKAPAVTRKNFKVTAEPEWQHALVKYWDGALQKAAK